LTIFNIIFVLDVEIDKRIGGDLENYVVKKNIFHRFVRVDHILGRESRNIFSSIG
jgi:hypothetical protein